MGGESAAVRSGDQGIFTTEELRAYFATTTRVGPAAHVATEEQYQTMRDAGAFDDDVIGGAADANCGTKALTTYKFVQQ